MAVTDKWRQKGAPSHTPKPRPEPVVVTVKEPIQDPGENCAVVIGRWLRLGQTEPIRDEIKGRVKNKACAS